MAGRSDFHTGRRGDFNSGETEDYSFRRIAGPLEPKDWCSLVGDRVATGLPAGWAIMKTIAAQADFDLPLAGAAVFLAVALLLGHVALHAAILGLGGSGHGRTLARAGGQGKFRW